MGKSALVGLLLLAGFARGADAPTYKEMPPGRYSMMVHGMICSVSARAIAAEWAKLPEVESATMDFDKMTGVVSVKLDKTLYVSSLKRALRRAEKVANLGERYELHDITYIP
jgi:hypothetical protein